MSIRGTSHSFIFLRSTEKQSDKQSIRSQFSFFFSCRPSFWPRLVCVRLSNDICSCVNKYQGAATHISKFKTVIINSVTSDLYLCVCGCVPSAARAWRRPCRKLDRRREGCESGCASSVLPGWCTPWSSVCSERLDAAMPLRVWGGSVMMIHREGAGGWTPDDARVQRGCCRAYYSGRRYGWPLDWGDRRSVHHPQIPHRCYWKESC